jgi:hypothetical protein
MEGHWKKKEKEEEEEEKKKKKNKKKKSLPVIRGLLNATVTNYLLFSEPTQLVIL